jgi:hypothetical protein
MSRDKKGPVKSEGQKVNAKRAGSRGARWDALKLAPTFVPLPLRLRRVRGCGNNGEDRQEVEVAGGA